MSQRAREMMFWTVMNRNIQEVLKNVCYPGNTGHINKVCHSWPTTCQTCHSKQWESIFSAWRERRCCHCVLQLFLFLSPKDLSKRHQVLLLSTAEAYLPVMAYHRTWWATMGGGSTDTSLLSLCRSLIWFMSTPVRTTLGLTGRKFEPSKRQKRCCERQHCNHLSISIPWWSGPTCLRIKDFDLQCNVWYVVGREWCFSLTVDSYTRG